MTRQRVCQRCGLTESEHHAFEPYVAPAGCVCEAEDWGNPLGIPPVCDALVSDGDGRCSKCEHDDACHEATP